MVGCNSPLGHPKADVQKTNRPPKLSLLGWLRPIVSYLGGGVDLQMQSIIVHPTDTMQRRIVGRQKYEYSFKSIWPVSVSGVYSLLSLWNIVLIKMITITFTDVIKHAYLKNKAIQMQALWEHLNHCNSVRYWYSDSQPNDTLLSIKYEAGFSDGSSLYLYSTKDWIGLSEMASCLLQCFMPHPRLKRSTWRRSVQLQSWMWAGL